MDSQQSLPEDLLLQEILPKLSTKSLVQCKCVSKTWLSLISQHSCLIMGKSGSIIRRWCNRLFFLGHNESNLVEIDTSYIYKKNPDRVVLVGSCNGVIYPKLVYSDETHDLVLWNPATREVNYLPNRKVYSDEKGLLSGYALGFDARSGDHKVIWLQNSLDSVEAEILSKKSGRWRHLKWLTGIRATVVFFMEGDGLTIDGAIYWPAEPFNVLSFDLSKEEFREFDGPLSVLTDPSIMDSDNFHFELINWKGSIGVVFVVPNGTEIHLWSKNKDGNNGDSGWNKISTIQPSLGPILFGIVFCGHIINISYRDNCGAEKEILYDLLTHQNRDLECLEKIWYYEFCEHFYTLVSPN